MLVFWAGFVTMFGRKISVGEREVEGNGKYKVSECIGYDERECDTDVFNGTVIC